MKAFEESHQSPRLTAALKEWMGMRQQDGKPVSREDLPDLLLDIVILADGDIEKAIAIVKQSAERHWLKFYDTKRWNARASPKQPQWEAPPTETTDLTGTPPPRIEDYAGDPEGFSRDLAAWNRANSGGENTTIQEKYAGGHASGEEREKILKAMGFPE